ncbi:hypothetical protein FPQ18DRAFT_339983 [Pyronema domesticum]|uniref:Uncharacterized protein n=1 Tax=Pyronema omphalodes (strain CBS 100304) TaxID=1076935 RepID=U4LBC3_PYROM|nr:hypothetical protein FPQ18DRAFT_339983 [Pyronema domesticum]CCX17120.1 Similar to hypothetical protein [Tuber melanosporum Mel28]; acc. no. XP_002839492 [Pyronema omphalodes CBS 100304]
MAYELHSKQHHPLSDSFSEKSSVPRSSRSAAITIPAAASDCEGCETSPASSPSSSGSSSPRSSPRSLAMSSTTASPTAPCPKEKQNDMWAYHRRRPRLLSNSFCRTEHTTFDMGMRDGSTRVIAFVKRSQGFDWNEDIFLPSGSDITIHNGINKPEEVHDIFLTDEDRCFPVPPQQTRRMQVEEY